MLKLDGICNCLSMLHLQNVNDLIIWFALGFFFSPASFATNLTHKIGTFSRAKTVFAVRRSTESMELEDSYMTAETPLQLPDLSQCDIDELLMVPSPNPSIFNIINAGLDEEVTDETAHLPGSGLSMSPYKKGNCGNRTDYPMSSQEFTVQSNDIHTSIFHNNESENRVVSTDEPDQPAVLAKSGLPMENGKSGQTQFRFVVEIIIHFLLL